MTKLNGIISALVLAAVATPAACGNEQFNGCTASGTCSPGHAGDSGEAGGGMETGGTSGSGAAGNSGEGGAATGGRTGGTGGIAGDATGGVAGDGGAGDQGGEGGMGPDPDTTPPTIVSVSPADGATGVRSDVNLVVTFSEPMDRVTTQAAYQSAGISGVTFSWNSENTVLTVNPNSDLTYAAGDLDVVAQAFAVTITDTAEDSAGNQMAGDFEWSFRTLRRITQTFATGSEWIIRGDASNNLVPIPCPTTPSYAIGDNSFNNSFHVIFERNITELPEDIVEWESANLTGNQMQVQGAPYDSFGPMLAFHTSIFPPSASTWVGPNLRELGPFATDATLGTKSVDVLDALVDDYEHRTERMQTSQFRLRFEQTTDNDNVSDFVHFECGSIVLTARYLIL